MIEVEEKFLLNPELESTLLKDAEFLQRSSNEDIYFDHPDFRLTKKEWWLRQRNGTFELKVALEQQRRGAPTSFFDELETDDAIREKIGLPTRGTLLQDLFAAGYRPFAKLYTDRRTYKYNEFTIDIDHTVSTPDVAFEYRLAEIELLVKTRADLQSAAERIMHFARSRGLATGFVPGKLLKFIEEKNAVQFAALVEAGIAKPSSN